MFLKFQHLASISTPKHKNWSKKFQYLDYSKIKKKNLHTPKISEYTSIIAKNNNIRKILKKYQTNFAKKPLSKRKIKNIESAMIISEILLFFN